MISSMRLTLLVTAAIAAAGCAVSPVSAAAAAAAAPPTLASAPGSPLAIAANSVAIGDVNGDRHQDLLVTVGTHLQTHLGDGTGAFRAAPDCDLDMTEPASELVVADVNGDDRPDAVAADHDRYEVSVFLNDGRGGFAPAAGSPFRPRRGRGDHPHTHGLAVCDVNHDGKPDVMTANNADGDVAVMLGDGRGGFASAAAGRPVFACGPSPYSFAATDVNGDGHPDLLIPNSEPGVRTMTVLLGDGTGAFAPAQSSPAKTPGDDVYFVGAGDVNGDGHPDAVCSNNHNDHATVLLNDGRGNFAAAPASPVPMGNRGWHLVVFDFDRDGKADLLAATETSVRVLFGDGRGDFRGRDPLVIPSGGRGCWKLAIADLNEDGIVDAVTPNVESKDLTILLGRIGR